MSNDAASLIIGIRTMKIKMFEGVVRVLGVIRHVLYLRMSFVFLLIKKWKAYFFFFWINKRAKVFWNF